MWALLRRFLTAVSRSDAGLRGSTRGSMNCFALRQCCVGVMLILYAAGLGSCIGYMVLNVCQSLCDHTIDSLGEVPGLFVCTTSSAVLLFAGFAFFVLFGVASVPMLGLVFALLGPPVVVMTIFWLFVRRFGTEVGCCYAAICLLGMALIAKWSARFFDSLCRCAGWELHVEEPLFMQNLGRPLNETDLAIERFIDQCIITGKELKRRELLSDEDLEETASALVIGLPAVTLLRSILDQGGDFFSTSGPRLFAPDAQDPDLRYLAQGLESVNHKVKPLCLHQLEVEQLVRALLGHDELPAGIETSLNLGDGASTGADVVIGEASGSAPIASSSSLPQKLSGDAPRVREPRDGKMSHQSSFATPPSSPLLASGPAPAAATATSSSDGLLPLSSHRQASHSSWWPTHWAFSGTNRGHNNNNRTQNEDAPDQTAYHTPVTPAHAAQPSASSSSSRIRWPWPLSRESRASWEQQGWGRMRARIEALASSSQSWSWWSHTWPSIQTAAANVPRRWRSMSSSSSLLSSSRPVSAEVQRRRDLRSILSSLMGLSLDVTRHEVFKRHCGPMFNQILDHELERDWITLAG